VITASDMLNSLIRYLGGANEDAQAYDIRESVVDGLDGFWAEHDWPYYQFQQPLQLDPPYSTGTVTYVAATRQLTLSGGVWPSWTVYGSIRIGGDEARFTKRISDTVAVLETGTAFQTDFSTPTVYALYRPDYPINPNIRKIANAFIEKNSIFPLEYMPPIEFKVRRPGIGASLPRLYTVTRDRNVPGGLVAQFWPYPGITYSARMNCILKPAMPVIWSETTGTVSVTQGSDAVTGVSTSFDALLHPGCVLRIGKTSADTPTAREGKFPYSDEMLIDAVTDATDLTTTSNFNYTQTGVKYEISSLIDIDAIMREAFFQRCLISLGSRRSFDVQKTSVIQAGYVKALDKARMAATVSRDVKYAGSFIGKYTSSYFTVVA